MLKIILPVFMCLAFSATASIKSGAEIQPDNLFPSVKFSTSHGDIVVELNRSRAEITVNNFLRYAANKSYDGTIFHRVINGFVVQGGGYDEEYQALPSYPAIINESGNGLSNSYATIAMARENDPHSATRQFYFNMADNDRLNPGKRWGYAVFGSVTQGEEVLEKIQAVETHMHPELLWADVPVNPVVLQSVTILPQN